MTGEVERNRTSAAEKPGTENNVNHETGERKRRTQRGGVIANGSVTIWQREAGSAGSSILQVMARELGTGGNATQRTNNGSSSHNQGNHPDAPTVGGLTVTPNI